MSRSMRQDLDAAMVGVILNEHRHAAILEAMRKGEKPMKKVIRPVVVLAAVIAALTISVLAFSPSLREVLTGVLGDFAPYSQNIEGVPVTDQGLQFKAVSAISDGNVAEVYFEVKDIEGDRLDEYVNIDTGFIDRPGANYASASFSSPKCLGYTAETRTALFKFRFTANGEPAMGGVLHMEMDSVLPGAHYYVETTSPVKNVAPGNLDSETLPTGEVVLLPGQTPIKFKTTDLVSVSSYGFATDGKLHVLLEYPEKSLNREETWGNFFFDSRSGDRAKMARYNCEDTDMPEVFFQKDGVWYRDTRYDITLADVQDIEARPVNGEVVTGQRIYGEWILEIPLENVSHRTISMDVTLGKVTIKSLDLTTLGASTECDPNGSGGTAGFPLTVFLADGSKILAGDADGAFHANSYAANHWSFPEPIDTSQIIGVAVGMWYTPLEGDIAGLGYWLDKLPE